MTDSDLMYLLTVAGVAVPVAILALIDWWGRRKQQLSKNDQYLPE